MKPNKQQKRRLDQAIIDRAAVSILLLTLASAGMVGAACAADGSDVRSPDAQITVHPNLTVLGDLFALNISDRVHEEYGREKSLNDVHDDINPTRDFNHAQEWMDLPPGEYQQMHEGGGDYGEIEYSRNWDGCTEGSDVIDACDEPVGNAPASASAYTPTAPEEFSGEVVQLAGTQTADIVWDKDNFGGFCYDVNGSVGTETLTIAAGTLTGPNVDRTIENGKLVYTTAPLSRTYAIIDDGAAGSLGSVSGRDVTNFAVEGWMGEEYVAIGTGGLTTVNANKLSKLLVEFKTDSDKKTLVTEEPWDIGRGFTLTAKQVDLEGNKVWLSLAKNGKEIDNSVIDTGLHGDKRYMHTEDISGVDDVVVFFCWVDTVFRGTESNLVQVKYVFLIDNAIHQINSGAYYDNMRVTSATSTQVTLENWKSLYLSQSPSTCQIMGNLSFKTIYNAGAIEFYPHLIRNEPPILSGGDGFASSGCGWYSWNLSENYTIGWNQVDLRGVKTWIVLCKDGVVVDERILTEEWSAPVDSDCRYSYAKNGTEIINATLKMVFRGCEYNMIELGEVYQRSEVDGSILTNNESHLIPTATEPSGIPWNLSDGYMLTVPDVGLQGDKVRLQLSKDGVVVKEKILSEDYANTFTYTSGIGGVNCVVDRVFRGCEANAVKLVDINQYSDASGTALIVDGSHFYKSGDPDGMPWTLMDGYVLTMKDIDFAGDKVWLELSKDDIVLKEDILESGDLFEYINDLESFDCVVEGVFRGTLADVVKLKNANQYSSTGTQLMDDESKTYATADPVGEIWDRWEGYSLAPKDIDMEGNKVWLSLLKDGVSVEDAIVDSRGRDIHDANNWFKYYNATGALVFSTYVDAVFRGTDTNLIQVRHTSQYSEVDGRLFIAPDAKSWYLQEGYYLTAQETYSNNSVWLQLSKNDKLVDEGLFYNSFDLQNDATGHTIVSGTVSGYNHPYDFVQLTSVTQYREATGTVLATYPSATLYATHSFECDKKTLATPSRLTKTFTVDDSSGADFTSIHAAVDAAIYGDTIYVHAGEYVENVCVDKRLTLQGEGADVVTMRAPGTSSYVFMVTADYVSISGFTMTGTASGYGIYLSGADHCNISGNDISNNSGGIYSEYSSKNILAGNTITVNQTGGYAIYLHSSGGNTLENNIAESDCLGILVTGYMKEDYNNSIDTSNMLNGKPIHYYYDLHGATIQGLDTTHLTVAYSDNVTIRNNNIRDGDIMFLPFLNDSTITGNTVQDNYYGIYLWDASNNMLYHNNLINNTMSNASDEGYANQWDDGSEGNYYSDYAGNDTDHDGIGDDPYYIEGSAGSVDGYPLMYRLVPQTGDLNHDNQITPADAAIALRIAASGGWDPDADVSGDDSVTSLDALMILQAAAGAIDL